MTTEALVVEGLQKSFGKLEVLRGIDLTLAEHEVVCLIGASGSASVACANRSSNCRASIWSRRAINEYEWSTRRIASRTR